MQGLREPKKNPAPTGEVEWRMIPAARESMYFSILWRSGLVRLNRLLEGSRAPGRRSIAQSYGRWGGKKRALDLLKTWCNRDILREHLINQPKPLQTAEEQRVQQQTAGRRTVSGCSMIQLLLTQSRWGLWSMSLNNPGRQETEVTKTHIGLYFICGYLTPGAQLVQTSEWWRVEGCHLMLRHWEEWGAKPWGCRAVLPNSCP